MPFLVTAHSTQPGKEDLYEKFLQKRKLWFVRNLPGVKRYDVYRTDHRVDDPAANKPADMRYNLVAVIEVEDLEAARKMHVGPEYQAFMAEYIGWLEEDPSMYVAHEVESTAELSKQEFIANHSEDTATA